MDLGLAPVEGRGVLVVALDEGVDRLAQLVDRGEVGPIEGAAGEDREPDLDLVGQAGGGARGMCTKSLLGVGRGGGGGGRWSWSFLARASHRARFGLRVLRL